MSEASMGIDMELIHFIVDFGVSDKLIHEARKYGISGSTVLLGKGTMKKWLWDYIGLSDIRKEIILMVADSSTADYALEKINEHFKFEKPNHGIAFVTHLGKTLGSRVNKKAELRGKENNNSTMMYQIITVIVEKGKAEDVIDAAAEAGSKGGTIINARGAGAHETNKVFFMDVEPEKEIVLILSEVGITDKILASINDKLKIDKPGNGIMYVQDAVKTYGLYQ